MPSAIVGPEASQLDATEMTDSAPVPVPAPVAVAAPPPPLIASPRGEGEPPAPGRVAYFGNADLQPKGSSG